MSTLLAIYSVAIVASACLASGLALLGAQLATRDRAVQTLCIGQGAMFGVLLGIGLCQVRGLEGAAEEFTPFALAAVFAVLRE